jgi:hypothetical protein
MEKRRDRENPIEGLSALTPGDPAALVASAEVKDTAEPGAGGRSASAVAAAAAINADWAWAIVRSARTERFGL